MIHFFTPYAQDMNLFGAIDRCMMMIHDPQDWVCIMDGDVMFLMSDFGHQIQEYIDKYPQTGLFTCYASRCHYRVQVRRGTDMENPSLLYHKKKAVEIHNQLQGQVKNIYRKIAGHLMVMKVETWWVIRDQVRERCEAKNKRILGVDTQISRVILEWGMEILLMRGIYVLHYLRLLEGFSSKNHLQ